MWRWCNWCAKNSRNQVAPFGELLFKNMVAMQENPTGSTILRVA
jgi:hypothetical protein